MWSVTVLDELLQPASCPTDSILNPAPWITLYLFLQSTIQFLLHFPQVTWLPFGNTEGFTRIGLLSWQSDHPAHLGFPVSIFTHKNFSSFRHSTSSWLVLLALTPNGISSAHASQYFPSRGAQNVGIDFCFLLISSFVISSESLVPSETSYKCDLRGSHLQRKFGYLWTKNWKSLDLDTHPV